MTRKIIFACLFLYISLFFLPKFCYKRTGNFWLQTILSDRSFDPRWETSTPSREELKNINQILSQPFHFLDGGIQSFVFISKDHKTVIKFFKHRPSVLKKGRFLTFTPSLAPILESYRIASELFSEETGIFYAHLNRTQGRHPVITLIDKIGIAHRIDMDQTEFVLQKRADLICTKLSNQMEDKDIDGAKRSIESLVCTLKSIYKQGVKNSDRAFRRNVGYIGERAILIDAGGLNFDSRILSRSEAKSDILEKGINLEKWLIRHYPQLYDHYHERINLEFGGSYGPKTSS